MGRMGGWKGGMYEAATTSMARLVNVMNGAVQPRAVLFVAMIRRPVDLVISTFGYHRSGAECTMAGAPSEIRSLCNGVLPPAPRSQGILAAADFVIRYALRAMLRAHTHLRNSPAALFLKMEDMKQNFNQSVSVLLAFLGMSPTPDTMKLMARLNYSDITLQNNPHNNPGKLFQHDKLALEDILKQNMSIWSVLMRATQQLGYDNPLPSETTSKSKPKPNPEQAMLDKGFSCHQRNASQAVAGAVVAAAGPSSGATRKAAEKAAQAETALRSALERKRITAAVAAAAAAEAEAARKEKADADSEAAAADGAQHNVLREL